MSSQLVTLVTYHYIRPTPASAKRFFALDPIAFRGQLQYLLRHYSPVRLADLVGAATGVVTLPPRPVVLTFDDGYRDHYENVFPLLVEQSVPAAFFPVRSALLERRVLNVNKVQFILAGASDPGVIIAAVEEEVERSEGGFEAVAAYRARWWAASRFDDPPIAYLKHLLQHALPESSRLPLVETLFRRYVTADEADFAAALYLDVEQAREMQACGLEFGGHGDRHIALSTLDREGQAREIDGALATLDAIGVPRRDFAYSFVKGAHDATSRDLLRARGCGVALTTREEVADLVTDDLLTLPRIDTNRFPWDAEAQPNTWTARVMTAE